MITHLLGNKVGALDGRFIRTSSAKSYSLDTESKVALADVLNKNNLSDYIFKLNVNPEQLDSFSNVQDWAVIALVASVPSFYMRMVQIVEDTYKMLPTALIGTIDWDFLISFLLKEGIWVIKYDA